MWNRVRNLYIVRSRESDEAQPDESPRIQQLRTNFENREAIYIEKGALRVRVTGIYGSTVDRTVWANVEEVAAPGLGVGLFEKRNRKTPPSVRWRIAGGYLTSFSDESWDMGYGGWSLHFDPKVVQGVLDLASQFPDDVDTHERYRRIIQFVFQQPTLLAANRQKVFPDAKANMTQ